MPAGLYRNTSCTSLYVKTYCIHIGVGFCVAYPCLIGNAKAWSEG